MEENGIKNRQCSWCGYYHVYYVKGSRRFERANAGYCSRQRKIVENKEYCEEWRYLDRKINAARKDYSLMVLSYMLAEISGIRQILQEEQEEEAYEKNML